MERVIGSWRYDIVSRRIICTHTVSAKDIYTIEVRNYDCLYQNKELTVSAPKSRDGPVHLRFAKLESLRSEVLAAKEVCRSLANIMRLKV